MLDDAAIRIGFYCKRLQRLRRDPATLIVEELGIDHGSLRADIAVINGRTTGYEIKSDQDSLARLPRQIAGYSRVFDYAHVIVTDRHLGRARSMVPDWWGIIVVNAGPHGALRFRTVRRGSLNPKVSATALARFLWRDEVLAILKNLGMRGGQLRGERAILYRSLVRRMTTDEVADLVRECLRSRVGWRDPSRPSPSDGSFQQIAMS
jgi:hypothetical protein